MSKSRSDGVFGCHVCWPTDAEAAHAASRGLKTVAQLIDESHYHVTIRACHQCGQAFLAVFTETIDWTEGEDPQYWTLLPIQSEEARDLISQGETVSEAAINSLGKGRRCLQHDYPKGKPPRTIWGLGFFVGPHD